MHEGKKGQRAESRGEKTDRTDNIRIDGFAEVVVMWK